MTDTGVSGRGLKRAARRQDLERAREFVIHRGATSRLWTADWQFDYAIRRSRVYGFLGNVVFVVMLLGCVIGWVLLWVWLFTRPTPTTPEPSALAPVSVAPWWLAGALVGAFVVIVILMIASMVVVTVQVALWTTLLVAPFETAFGFLGMGRKELEKTDTDFWTNLRDPFLDSWLLTPGMTRADVRWLRRAERALTFPFARGRRYRTSGARSKQRGDWDRAAALLGWIESELMRQGEPFKAEALEWLAALQIMTMMQDCPIDLPGDDHRVVRRSLAKTLGQVVVTVLTLFFAALPVVALIAPELFPQWR